MEKELRGGVQYLNILRRTIAPENVPSLATLDKLNLGGLAIKHQAVMHALSQSRSALRGGLSTKHPGHDCLTIRSDVLRRIDFGDIFIAMPVGARIDSACMQLALTLRLILWISLAVEWRREQLGC